MEEIMLNIRDFICLHYINNKKESFWKEQIMPDSLQFKLDIFKNRLPIREDFRVTQFTLFRESHYMAVMHGMGLFDVAKLKKQYNMLGNEIKTSVKMHKINTEKYIPHKKWLERIRNEF